MGRLEGDAYTSHVIASQQLISSRPKHWQYNMVTSSPPSTQKATERFLLQPRKPQASEQIVPEPSISKPCAYRQRPGRGVRRL